MRSMRECGEYSAGRRWDSLSRARHTQCRPLLSICPFIIGFGCVPLPVPVPVPVPVPAANVSVCPDEEIPESVSQCFFSCAISMRKCNAMQELKVNNAQIPYIVMIIPFGLSPHIHIRAHRHAYTRTLVRTHIVTPTSAENPGNI